jgi:hypothetical protein
MCLKVSPGSCSDRDIVTFITGPQAEVNEIAEKSSGNPYFFHDIQHINTAHSIHNQNELYLS